MSRLLRVLFAALLLTLLVTGVAFAADVDEANELIAEANATLEEHNALDMRAGELLDEAFAIDPSSANATDALPPLGEVETILVEMKAKMTSIAALWAEVGALAVTAEQATYAGQQGEIARAYLEAHDVTGALLTRYQILYDPGRLGALTGAEVDELDQEFAELGDESDRLYAEIEDMELASYRYYEENRLDEWAGGSLGWIGLIVSLAVASGSAVLCGVLAGRKNRNVIGWGVLGFVAGIIGVVAVLTVKKVEPAVGASSMGAAPLVEAPLPPSPPG